MAEDNRFSTRGVDATGEINFFEVCRRFHSRGHDGKVQCVNVSPEADFIVSGGEDYTTRIWRRDALSDAYIYAAVIQHDVPPQVAADRADAAVCWGACFLEEQLQKAGVTGIGAILSPHAKEGVTVVACTGSKWLGFVVGEVVSIEQDAEYVQAELDDMRLKYEDKMDAYLGESLPVVDVNAKDGLVGVMLPSSSPVYFPNSCIQRCEPRIQRNGPILSGTAHGELVILCLASNDDEGLAYPFENVHSDAINDICIVPYGSQKENFFVVTASDDGDVVMILMECEETADHKSLKLKNIPRIDKRLKHEGPVLSVKQVGEVDVVADDRALFATLVAGGVTLWTVTGQSLMFLTIPEKALIYNVTSKRDERVPVRVRAYHTLVSTNKDSGSLLFVAAHADEDAPLDAQGYVAVWALQDGMVEMQISHQSDRRERENAWQTYMAQWRDNKRTSIIKSPMPKAVYHQRGLKLDVDQSGTETAFFVEAKKGFTCAVWTTQAVESKQLAVEPTGPASLLVMSGHERLEMELVHSSHITDLRVFEDFYSGDFSSAGEDAREKMRERGEHQRGGPSVLVGCADGEVVAWDLTGTDKGQIYVRLGSVSLIELCMPVVSIVVTAIQVTGFAFGPSVGWDPDIELPMEQVHEVAMIDFAGASTTLSRCLLFYEKEIGSLTLMVVFVLAALLGLRQKLEKWIRKLQHTPAFRSGRSSCSPVRILLVLLRLLRVVVALSTQLLSTVCVAPLFTSVARAFDCIKHEDEDGLWWAHAAPHVQCYVGAHRKLLIMILLVVPCYLFVLMPFAGVRGDGIYVTRETLFDYKFWKPGNAWGNAARRQATTTHHGPWHQMPANAFFTHMVEVFAKVSLPIIVLWTRGEPKSQLSLVGCVGFTMYVSARKYKPYLQDKVNTLVFDIKLFTIVAPLCGLLNVVVREQELTGPEYSHFDQLPVLSLVVLCSVILGHMLYVMFTERFDYVRERSFKPARRCLQEGRMASDADALSRDRDLSDQTRPLLAISRSEREEGAKP